MTSKANGYRDYGRDTLLRNDGEIADHDAVWLAQRFGLLTPAFYPMHGRCVTLSWVVPPPIVGQQVTYQVRRGHRIPMLITAVHFPDLIDGVAFSARPSDVGNSYGSRGFQRIKRGDGDGQWQTSP